MTAKDLAFNLLGRDISASAAFERLAVVVEGLKKEVEEASAATSVSAKKMSSDVEASGARIAGSHSKTGSGLKTLALGAVAAGALVAGAGVEMAVKFQASMTLLRTAAGESQKNMKTVSNGILNIATATGTSTEQLAEGMYTIEKAGIRGADGLKVLKAAAEGAKAENVDLGTATNALTSIMMSYHMTADKAVSAENMLISGSGLAKTSMQSYAGALSTVLPVASAAGISFAQVAGAIATLTQHGTSAEESTNELANTIRSLQAPNQVASKAMQQLGLNVTDVSQNLGKRGLTGTIDLITEAIKNKMGPAGLVVVDSFKQSQAASNDARIELGKLPPDLQKVAQGYLNGTITQKQWRKELQGMSVDHRQLAQQFAATVNQSRGFNDLLKAGSPAAATFAGYLSKVMGGATGMNTALMLGGENMAYFKKATDEVGAAGQKTGADISTWAQTQQNLSVQFDKAKQTLEVFAIRIGNLLIPWVTKLLVVIRDVVGWFDKHRTITLALASAVAAVAGAFLLVALKTKLVESALRAVNMVMDMSPWARIALLVLAIGTALVAAYKHSQTFRDVVKTVFHDVEMTFLYAGKYAIQYLLIPVLDIFSAIVHGAASAFGWVPGIGGKLKKARTAFDDFRKGVDKTLHGIQVQIDTEHAQAQTAALAKWLQQHPMPTLMVSVQENLLPATHNAGNGTYTQHATGGYLTEGWNIANEQGIEAMYKQGPTVRVFTAPQTRAMRPAASTGGVTFEAHFHLPGLYGGTEAARPIVTALERWVQAGGLMKVAKGVHS
ncbi:MAG TPA: phage tail tape measure protein [Pseudonocardiaceae bacterium]|nr:phage tail tape measure protein [Pseudonocardiaceae bacterium]